MRVENRITKLAGGFSVCSRYTIGDLLESRFLVCFKKVFCVQRKTEGSGALHRLDNAPAHFFFSSS